MTVRLEAYLGDLVQAVREGHHLDAGVMAQAAGRIRAVLAEVRGEVEGTVPRVGLESLSRAILEAVSLYQEAVDLLLLAALDDSVEAAEQAAACLQAAGDTLRTARQVTDERHRMLDEEMPLVDQGS